MNFFLKSIIGIFILVSSCLHGQDQIFATIAGGDLYSVDIQNCTRSFIGSTGFGFGDIAITPDGQLWGTVQNSLYNINPVTAEATFIGTGLGPGVSLVALNDTILLRESGLNLFGINTNTAETFYIDTIGFQAAGDLTWYDEDLYLVTFLDMIIRIELADDFQSIENVTPIGSGVPSCQGAITASFEDDINHIIGFNGPNLYKICPYDGTSEILCPELNIGGTPGAAATRLPFQNPIPGDCEVNSVGDYSPLNSVKLFPNPSKDVINVSSDLSGKISYSIRNTIGQNVRIGEIHGNAIIDIKSLSNGIYFIEFKIGNDIQVMKIIKNK